MIGCNCLYGRLAPTNSPRPPEAANTDIDVVFKNLELVGGTGDSGGVLLLEDCTNGAVEGATYQAHTVFAEDTLVISGLETGPECAGIAGIQVVPEPAMGASLGVGLVILSAAANSRRRRRH